MIFAHTDIHIGSYENNPKLSKLEENAFYSMMDHCMENNVDFIVIAGVEEDEVSRKYSVGNPSYPNGV